MRQLALSKALHRVQSDLAAREMRGLGDAELLSRFVAERDEAAFCVLMQRHSSMVLGVCRRVLAQVQDAEDACQATFLVLARKAGSIRKTESLGSWLHGVAYRTSLRLKAEATRWPRSNSSMADPAQRDTTSTVSWREVMQVLDEELARMPAAYRATLILCYLEGQTLDEGAKRLGWTLGTFRGRLERGRLLLRQRLIRRGVTLPAVLFGVGLSFSIAPAAVPPTLVAATVKAAMFLVAGQAPTCGLISANVVALMEGMLLTKVKTALALVLVAAAVLAVWVGLCLVVAPPMPAEAPAQNPLVEQPILVANAPNPPGPRMDLFGDPLPAHALARLGTERFRSDAWAQQIAVVPGGKQLLGLGSAAVIVWDAATGREIRRFETSRWRKAKPDGIIVAVRMESLAASPDGKLIAAGTTHQSSQSTSACPILLFDRATGRKLAELTGHTNGWLSANRALVFATPTRLVSAGADHTVRVWDVTTQQEIKRLETSAGSTVSELVVSPDGKRVFGAGNEKDYSSFWGVWDIDTGKFVHWQDKLPGYSVRLALSPDARTVAIAVGMGAFGQGGASNEVRIHSVSDWKELRRWQTHDGRSFPQRNAIAYAPDGRTIATGGADQKVRRWDADSGKEIGLAIEPYQDAYQNANNVTYLDRATLITFGSQNTVKFWDAASGRPKLDFVGSEAPVTAVAFAPDGRRVATGGGGGDATVRVWDATTGKQVGQLRAEMYEVTCVEFSPDGKLIASTDRGGVARLWDWVAGKEIQAVRDHKPWLYRVTFSPDGKHFATGDEAGVVRVWDVTGGKLRHTLVGHRDQIRSLVFSPDGRTLFSAGIDGSIRQWDLAIGNEIRVIQGVRTKFSKTKQTKPVGQTSSVTGLALSPDGRRLFSGSSFDDTICVWEVASGRLSRVLKARDPTNYFGVRAIALSPDGTQLAAAIGDDGESASVHLWDALTGEKIGSLPGHRGKVIQLAYAPNGGRLVSTSEDTTAMVWDMTGLQRRRPQVDANTLAGVWRDLGDVDTENGYTAVCRFVAAGDTAVAVLRAKLERAIAPDLSKASALIKQLDDPEFRKREQAIQALKTLGLSIEPLVRKTVANAPTLEVKRRLEKIVPELMAEGRRQERSLEVLEMIGTANARAMLTDLATGDPDARLTREARAALKRLEQRLVQ